MKTILWGAIIIAMGALIPGAGRAERSVPSALACFGGGWWGQTGPDMAADVLHPPLLIASPSGQEQGAADHQGPAGH